MLGANGSGKSTVVRAVVGLLPLATGSLELFGTPHARFREWTAPGLRAAAGGRDHRRPGDRARGRRDRTAGAQGGCAGPAPPTARAVDDAIASVGLTDRARDNVGTLSGGQQQRVLIARALTCEPELLVLDEPTAGVDLVSQTALADTLRDLVARGTTVVLVAHELGPLHPLITRALTMADGRVLHDGAPPAPGPPARARPRARAPRPRRARQHLRRPGGCGEPARARLHAPGAGLGGARRAGRPGGRRVPGAAPPGADGRRDRARRADRRRAGLPARDRAGAHGRRRRDRSAPSSSSSCGSRGAPAATSRSR